MLSSAAKKAVELMGFPDYLIDQVILARFLDKLPAFKDVQELFLKVDEIANDSEKLAELATIYAAHKAKCKLLGELKVFRDLKQENQRLKDRELCRICKIAKLRDGGITFLPCGHFITCEACSSLNTFCVACGTDILHSIRTFLV